MSPAKRVAIVSPFFPPSNLAGVHRARLLSKHLPTYSWEPVVICVHERHHEETPDYRLAEMVPDSVRVLKTGAIPATATRPVGLGDIGIRAYWHLERAVSNLLAAGGADILFITMSPYYNALSASKLKRKFQIPVVFDFQDPWVSRWGESLSIFSKGGISHRLATWLEPRLIRIADHVTSVSEGANDEIRARYPRLPADALSAMPIGGDADDYEILKLNSTIGDPIQRYSGELHLSYVGTVLPRGYPALRAVLMALARLKESHSDLYGKLKLNFVGTSGQSEERRKLRVIPHAMEFGVADRITEIPERLSYLEALGVLASTDVVLVMGSDEPHYTASKLHPSLLARRPLLAIFHEKSSACDMVRRVGGAELVTFTENDELPDFACRVSAALLKIVREPTAMSPANHRELSLLSADSIAQRFAALFDKLIISGCRSPWW